MRRLRARRYLRGGQDSQLQRRSLDEPLRLRKLRFTYPLFSLSRCSHVLTPAATLNSARALPQNAALYLVSMPQATNASACFDKYCDANDVCGERCAEIDLMEANAAAWVSTVHVPDDGNGEGFGMAHYTIGKDHASHTLHCWPNGRHSKNTALHSPLRA